MSSPRIFQSTRPIRGATHHGQRLGREVPISIHAPHTGRDWRSSGDRLMTKISIHAPHTGRDVAVQESRYGVLLFQSTRPIRGATWGMVCRSGMVSYFNPRAPYGARQHGFLAAQVFKPISIHAPHTGRDRRCDGDCFMVTIISIHAPHTGRDHGLQRQLLRQEGFQSTRPIRGATPFLYTLPLPRLYFNPRAPYGARRQTVLRRPCGWIISIHAPHTGRDRYTLHPRTAPQRISIHAPHTGRDSSCRTTGAGFCTNFNPRAPYGARLCFCFALVIRLIFQSTRPIRGATKGSAVGKAIYRYFNPRAPYGARPPACFSPVR